MKKGSVFTVVLVFMICGLFSATGFADPFRVLVVMSYDEDYHWEQEIREGIDTILSGPCEVRYFYLGTKKNPGGGEQKAAEAYQLYQEFQPHGVIAADDNAQSMFVVPYLKDKVDTPVMFCGVNAEPETYGYPASNVSGILERMPIGPGIMFAREIVPSVKKVGFIMRDEVTAEAFVRQIEKEKHTYSAEVVEIRLPRSMTEAVSMTEELRKTCDLLFITLLEGILDKSGHPLLEKEAVPVVVSTFGKPTLTITRANVRYGVLCSMLATGQEQGQTASEMLLKAMQGTPVAQIPVTQNQKGKALINVTTMRALGISPRPAMLNGVELLETEK